MIYTLFLASCVLAIAFYALQLSYWTRRGIPGPPGKLFLGHFWEIANREYPGVLSLRDWTKKYGKVYGIQEGFRKILVVSDVNMLQEMFVKKFEYFYERKNAVIVGDVENDPRVHLFESQGNRWKRLRTICAPTFSSNSLKRISSTVEDSAIEFVRLLEDVSETDPVNIHIYFQEYTMDIISRIAMGQVGSNMFHNPLTPYVKQIFSFNLKSPIMVLAAVVPFLRIPLRKLFIAIAKILKSPALPIFETCYKIVDERIAQREKDAQDGSEPGEPNDFIDLFLDARAEETVDDATTFNKDNLRISRSLTREEIVAQCFVFLLAGFDTTSNALAYTSWLLVTHPEKQKTLLDEIDTYCSNSESISYDTLAKLKYMDAVIKETLRMFPLASMAASRTCMKATTLGDTPIKEGMLIWADVWSIHYDKEIWGIDADEFVPERWQRDEVRHSMAWLPFGAGPRLCIGQRLAYVEEKLALIHLLRRFTLNAGPKTETILSLKGSATVQPEAVTVYLKRHQA